MYLLYPETVLTKLKKKEAKAYQLPQEEKLCISLVYNFHGHIKVAIWREVHSGRVETLV